MLAILFSMNMNAALGLGDSFTQDGRQYEVIGANLIPNPTFDSGITSWVSGANNALTSVTINVTGGVDGGSYIVPAGGGIDKSQSIGTGWAIAAGKTYVFDHYVKYTNAATVPTARDGFMLTSLTNNITLTAEPKVLNSDTILAGGVWTLNRKVFTNNVPYAYLQYRARWLGGKGFDDFFLGEVKEKADN